MSRFAGIDFGPGDSVERRYCRAESRFGQVRHGHDARYVTVGDGMTYCDNGRDLRRAVTAEGTAPNG